MKTSDAFNDHMNILKAYYLVKGKDVGDSLLVSMRNLCTSCAAPFGDGTMQIAANGAINYVPASGDSVPLFATDSTTVLSAPNFYNLYNTYTSTSAITGVFAPGITIVNGSPLNDTFTFGAATVAYNSGGGNNTITLSQASTFTLTGATSPAVDVMNTIIGSGLGDAVTASAATNLNTKYSVSNGTVANTVTYLATLSNTASQSAILDLTSANVATGAALTTVVGFGIGGTDYSVLVNEVGTPGLAGTGVSTTTVITSNALTVASATACGTSPTQGTCSVYDLMTTASAATSLANLFSDVLTSHNIACVANQTFYLAAQISNGNTIIAYCDDVSGNSLVVASECVQIASLTGVVSADVVVYTVV